MLVEAFKHIHKVMELNLGRYIYIYIYIGSNDIGMSGTEILVNGFKFLPNLEKLHLSNLSVRYNIYIIITHSLY